MSDTHDLELLLNSRIPILNIETREERRALGLLQSVCVDRQTPLFRWTITEGLQRLDLNLEPQAHAKMPSDALAHIKASAKPGVYVLLDFHPYLDEPLNVRLLKDIALNYHEHRQTLVFISHDLRMPDEVKNFSASLNLRVPDNNEIERIVKDTASAWMNDTRQRVKADPQALEQLVTNLSGLTHAEAARLARTAIYDDGAITPDDVPNVMQAKYELLNKQGMLHFELDTESFANVGGFNRLKTWLRHRQPVFEGRMSKLDTPKGILLLGVQGCGKSLAAKAVAGVLGIPLLRLEMSALFNKFHGETERNLRESLQAAQVMAPCVLWIDELEKGISIGEHDGGTSRRILGTLLTWMAEKDQAVFMVATANDIERLPPELVRKGRFDEIFFVDLPDNNTRELIYSIHLRRRAYDPANFELSRLAEASEGFSGAEIEQSVVAAIYASHAHQVELNTTYLLQEIRQTKPLSIVMAERISALRDWANGRTVPVD